MVAPGNQPAISETILTDDSLAAIQTFDDALALVQDAFGGTIVEADKEIGTGFALLDKKDVLIGIPLIIIKSERNVSDIRDDQGNPRHFWSLHIVTKAGGKFIVNDGGTGLAAQMDELTSRHPERRGIPILVRKGLRVSRYTHPMYGASETFYLDTSADA